MNSRKMKGSILDIPFILAMISAGVVTVFISAIILVSLSNAWPFGGDSATILAAGVEAIYIFDQMIIVYAVGVSLFSIISAFFVRSHPAFFVFSMILLSLTIFFSAQIANAINAFMVAAPFAAIVNNFPMTLTLVRNFPVFSLIIGALIALALYSKGENEGPRTGV